MAPPQEYVKKVEEIIGYAFSSEQYIHQALTAAGAEGENYDGNRRLSQIGASLVDTLLAVITYGTSASRASTATLRSDFTNKDHYATVARQTGIVDCICYDNRKGARSPAVLRKALNAIIAAVFLDTWNPKLTMGLILRIFTQVSIGSNFFMPSATAAPANFALSLGVDIFLNRWTEGYYPKTVVDEVTNGEAIPNSGIAPNVQLVESEPPSTAATTSLMGASQGVAGWTTANLGIQTRGFIDEFPQFPDPAGITQPMAEQNVILASNVESFDPGRMDCITPDPRSFIRSFNENLCLSSQNYYGRERPSKSFENPRKRKRMTDRPSSPTKTDLLQEYLLQEGQKCTSLGLALPEETYLNRDVQKSLRSLDAKHPGTLITIFLAIANSRSILALQDVIRNKRTHRSFQSYLLRNGISHKERFDMIQELDQKTTLIQLVKWYHIVELFQECGGSGTRSCTGYVINTPANFEHQTRILGNPGNREGTKVAQSMMSEIFPDIRPAEEDYQKKLSAVKRLRKLGERLHTLASKFGRGIFGLMLNCSPFSDSMPISDSMILRPDGLTFEMFVNLLEKSQGDILRKFSEAILPLLNSITHSTMHQAQSFKLEKIDAQDIVGQAKGSEALLRLIS